MKKHFLTATLLAAAIIGVVAATKTTDPVVMTIDGDDIRQSEFEYLYKKNNIQQENPQTLDEYVDMFVVYKLKVADAKAAGIDTTQTFLKEFRGYCADITGPYLVDTLVRDRLVNEAWQRMQTMRRASHIMVPLGNDDAERAAASHYLDSIRTLIINGADFAEMARKHSADRSAVQNGGDQGFFGVGRFPYPFEKAAYDTPIGEVSGVIEDAPYGWHIIKPTDEKPHPGTILARHILKATRGLSPEEQAVKKAQIDSIYELLMQGGDFGLLAKDNSDDPGSAENGGMLNQFGPGQMVAEFEQTAYALNDNQISAPFLSPFGWHIVQTIKHYPLGTLEQNRGQILTSMLRDERSKMPRQSRINELQQRWGLALDAAGMEAVKKAIESAPSRKEAYGQIDGSTVVATIKSKPLFSAADVINAIPENTREKDRSPWGVFERQAKASLEEATVDQARSEFVNEYPDYRNLVNEYRDGILLFEISNRKVWERAAKDTDALNKYYAEHSADYTWEKPHFKGFVILATSDSLLNEARTYLNANTIETDSLVSAMNARFGRDIKVERVLTGKGDNKIIDEIAFDGPKADAVGRWTSWFPYAYRIIDAPEEAADVKAAVSADLQKQLEADWIRELRAKYKVKPNKKALKQMAEQK